MEQLIYLLKVTACTALFFSFYFVVLRKLTFFKINRFYLLATLFLSFVIPATQINVVKEAKIIETPIPMKLVETQNIGMFEKGQAEILPMPAVETSFDWFSAISFIYFSVAAVLLVVSFWQLFRLILIAKGFTKTHHGLKLIKKTQGFTNCSFFNYIFIDETNLCESDLRVLLQHEQVHANQYHSIDKIILMVAKTVLWFNPIIYLFDEALEQTHEYEADQATAQHCGNNTYAKLLLRLAVSKNSLPLLHNFVKSPIKNRIKMLFNSKSKGMKKVSYLLVLPFGLGLVWLFSVQMVYINSKVKTNITLKSEKKNEVKAKREHAVNTKIRNEETKLLSRGDTIKINRTISPKIISSSALKGDVKRKIVYLEDAVIEILGSTIKAKYVEWNQKEKVLVANHAVIANQGNMIIGEKAIFNLLDGTYRVYESDSELENKASFTDFNLKENDNMIAKSIRYSAVDSIRMTKDKLMISLYGSAKINFKDITMEADEISFNQKTLTGSAKNLVITQVGSGVKIRGTNAKFNLNGKVEIWQPSVGKLIVEP